MTDWRSGWWIVVLTTLVVEVLVYEIWEASDTWRLWRLPRKVPDVVHRLDMHTELGVDGLKNAKRAVKLLGKRDWESVLPENTLRMQMSKNWSPERSGSVENFIWVSPFE